MSAESKKFKGIRPVCTLDINFYRFSEADLQILPTQYQSFIMLNSAPGGQILQQLCPPYQ